MSQKRKNDLHLYDYSYCVKDFIIKHQKNSTNTYTLRLYLHIDSNKPQYMSITSEEKYELFVAWIHIFIDWLPIIFN